MNIQPSAISDAMLLPLDKAVLASSGASRQVWRKRWESGRLFRATTIAENLWRPQPSLACGDYMQAKNRPLLHVSSSTRSGKKPGPIMYCISMNEQS
jgi:hypothetical protein